MSWIAVHHPNDRIVVRTDEIVVERGGAVIQTLPIDRIEQLIVVGDIPITPAARRRIAREGVDTVFVTPGGRFVGRLIGAGSRAGARRLAQVRTLSDPDAALRWAREIVSAKIRNQHTLLRMRQRRARDEVVANALARMRALATAAETSANIDALRGTEGMAARLYFGGLGKLVLHPGLQFTGRNRRPPRDPINACLSFLYTVLVTRVETAVLVSGMDPFAGALHTASRGAPSLALDLAEELRPVVDQLVLTLVNRRQLGPDDFRVPTADELGPEAEVDEEACYASRVGREILLRAWGRRLQQADVAPDGQRRRLADIIDLQARQAVRRLTGDSDVWAPFRLGGE